MTREEWLERAVNELSPRLTSAGYTVPTVRVSCGWPSTRALAKNRRRIGECWSAVASADGTPQIFISPILSEAPVVLDVLVHELGHAVLPHGAGHGKPFRQFMREVGLTGKPTATSAGPDLAAYLAKSAVSLGPYPHASIDRSAGPTKKQTTRMKKISCSAGHDDYVLRGSRKTLDLGVPDCPVCGAEMRVDEEENEEENQEDN